MPSVESVGPIVRVESVVLRGTRPRVIGRNARLPVHGQFARDRIVRLITADGLEGWGWSVATDEEARQLLGKRPAELFQLPEGTKTPFLSFDFPLWDLVGQALGQPVWKLLGDGGPHPVPVYDGSIYIDEIDPETGQDKGLQPILDAVQTGLEAGFWAFKVKVGRGYRWMEKAAGLRRDIEVIRAVREKIGPERTLLIDANNGYTPEEAQEVILQTEDCRLEWIEEPFPEEKEACLAFKRFLQERGKNILLADGEGATSQPEAFTEIVRAGGIDVVQFDMRAYTLTRWARYRSVLEETGALAAPHNWGSHLSGFYVAHFGRACPQFATDEIDPMEMPGVIAEGYRMQAGRLVVPEAPGFGLRLDPETYQVALRQPEAWSVAA